MNRDDKPERSVIRPFLRATMDLTSAIQSHPYLDDGNVALAALSSKGVCHIFRVHRSVLCMQSVIFADMFAVSAPTNAASHETYAGAVLVRMQDDANDLRDLLKMMYDSSCVAPASFASALADACSAGI